MDLLSKKPPPIRRKDVGIAGAVIVLSQLLSSFQSSQTVTTQMGHLQEEFQQLKVDRELYFVRKADIVPLTEKLDKLNDKLISINENVSVIKRFLKDNKFYDEVGYLGCVSLPVLNPYKEVPL